MEKATFGAGCFWHVEEEFRSLSGVLSTAVGYCAHDGKPSYGEVCSQLTVMPKSLKLLSIRESSRMHGSCSTSGAVTIRPSSTGRAGLWYELPLRYLLSLRGTAQAAERSLAEEEASGRHRRPIVTEIRRPLYSGKPKSIISSIWQKETAGAAVTVRDGHLGSIRVSPGIPFAKGSRNFKIKRPAIRLRVFHFISLAVSAQ